MVVKGEDVGILITVYALEFTRRIKIINPCIRPWSVWLVGSVCGEQRGKIVILLYILVFPMLLHAAA